MTMTPGETQPDGYLIVCPSHGELTDRPAADEIAADLVRREHREDCGQEPEIVREGDLEFEPGSAYVDDVDDGTLQASFPEGGGS